ncbi:MAG: hypothetical protein LBE62_07215 [Azonexus sp.]|jgi:hypothetical protein|nr:hypothetical protein [Azonexus sp.]
MSAAAAVATTTPAAGRYRVATAADGPALAAMLRDNPMDGPITLALEREPDYFAAGRLFGEDTSVIAETADGDPVGMYGCAMWDSYLNGLPQRCAYLHGLRVNTAYRRRLRWLRDGYASIPRLAPRWNEAACCFTSVASDNQQARRLLEAGLGSLPRYVSQGEMVTLLLPARRGRSHGLLRQARREDVPAICELHRRHAQGWQFAPCLDEAWLRGLTPAHGLALENFWLHEQDGEPRFCAALWDQRHCKQTVARGYHGVLRWLRPGYNLWARMARRVPLPLVGERMEHVFIAFAAFADDAPLMLRCLEELLAHVAPMRASSAVLGLSARHPLLRLAQRRFRPLHYRTCIETVTWPNQDEPVLDGRPVQPEVALL